MSTAICEPEDRRPVDPRIRKAARRLAEFLRSEDLSDTKAVQFCKYWQGIMDGTIHHRQRQESFEVDCTRDEAIAELVEYLESHGADEAQRVMKNCRIGASIVSLSTMTTQDARHNKMGLAKFKSFTMYGGSIVRSFAKGDVVVGERMSTRGLHWKINRERIEGQPAVLVHKPTAISIATCPAPLDPSLPIVWSLHRVAKVTEDRVYVGTSGGVRSRNYSFKLSEMECVYRVVEVARSSPAMADASFTDALTRCGFDIVGKWKVRA